MEKTITIGTKSYTLTSDDNYLSEMGNVFEPNMVELFNSLIEPNDVVADIGGNIGMTALLFADLSQKVYVFEPSPSTFNFLKKNIERSKVNNVEIVNLGLGDKCEKLTITFSDNNRSGGFVSDKIKPVAGHVTEDIQINTLDNWLLQNRAQPKFIKIDVEGFEENVIRGGLEYIRLNKPIVTLELNHFCLNVLHRKNVPDFFDFLLSVFPFLFAIDTDNATILDLHNENQAYEVMHQHVTRFRFPNLVGGFSSDLKLRLNQLELVAKSALNKSILSTPEIVDANGSMGVINYPTSVQCCERFDVEVEVLNESKSVWHGYGANSVFLSYHWHDMQGKTIVFDGERSVLTNADFQPGQMQRATMNIVAPKYSGDYVLIVTIVQENVSWLETRGFFPQRLNILVN